MNEIPPPEKPEQEPDPDRSSTKPYSKPLTAVQATILGIGLCGIAILLAIVTFGISFLVGFVLAIVCLFIRGYRFVSLGFLLGLGIFLLSTIIYCSNTRW